MMSTFFTKLYLLSLKILIFVSFKINNILKYRQTEKGVYFSDQIKGKNK